MRLRAALMGDLERYMADELALSEVAVTAGIRNTVTDTKHALRSEVVQAGLGRRLANSWRSKMYPGAGHSLDAAGVVYTKSPHLIRAFDQGVTIKGKTSSWLAVPTEHAPKRGTDRKRIHPGNFPESRLGELRFIYRKGQASLLVVDNQRQRKGKRGGFAPSRSKRALKTGNGLATVIMFFLVPQVRLKRRLNVKKETDHQAAQLARQIDDEFRRRSGKEAR
ncbi:DUF6441 family protein [Pseudophaeobacter sp.]|jgi:hypothetical protein|uniref:DUF6441 family protein n=1 Tax=Pseudophaeobacter sp. TaxID=1971739 RepID=UPI0032653987